ncbi:MAG: hypothetical protein ACREP8_13145, partial [Candidatus Binatia bacterium]
MGQPALVYLDHNVLDLMTKGDPDRVAQLLTQASVTTVFSDETLAEIRRSTGYERTFLELLEQLRARHLVPVLDKEFKHTGNAEVRLISPFDAYSNYIANVDSMPELGFGLAGILQKFYGGRQDQSFAEILAGGATELRALLEKLNAELADIPNVDDQSRVAIAEAVASIPRMLEEQSGRMAAQLDADPEAAVRRFEGATGLGPKALKNIERPDVVRKVWELVQPSLPGAGIDMDTFFGITPFPWEADAGRERTTLEKVNAIYHQLNFLGYYRDSNMSRRRRFNASFSDMTHAGLASFCHVLISRDEDLVMKAAAAYE